ncbi:MAG: hypothetical protein M1819_005243 [Sarea resinae]|nr:MAG: hypothetical protein M1819_005243 [Sarea resinae]
MDSRHRARLIREMARDLNQTRRSGSSSKGSNAGSNNSTSSSSFHVDAFSTQPLENATNDLPPLRDSAKKYKSYFKPEAKDPVNTSALATEFADFSQGDWMSLGNGTGNGNGNEESSIEIGRGHPSGSRFDTNFGAATPPIDDNYRISNPRTRNGNRKSEIPIYENGPNTKTKTNFTVRNSRFGRGIPRKEDSFAIPDMTGLSVDEATAQRVNKTTLQHANMGDVGVPTDEEDIYVFLKVLQERLGSLETHSQNKELKLKNEIARRDDELSRQAEHLARLDEELAQRDANIAKRDAQIARLDKRLSQRDADIVKRDEQIAGLEAQFAGRDERISHLEARLAGRADETLLSKVSSNDGQLLREKLEAKRAKKAVRWQDYEDGPTIRPSEPPAVALAFVIQGLEDELAHLKEQNCQYQEEFAKSDASMGKRARKALHHKIRSLLVAMDAKSDQIYSLYDVLESQKQADECVDTSGPDNPEEPTEELQDEDDEYVGWPWTGRDEEHEEHERTESSEEAENTGEPEGTEELPWAGQEEFDECTF